MKLLSFEFKRNLKKPPRVHVKSANTGTIYGSFPADAPDMFEGWHLMDEAEAIELKLYINNLQAIKTYLSNDALNEQADYRLRLPASFIDVINEIALICHRENMSFDIFSPMLTAIIQEIKIITAKLENTSKTKALKLLDQLGLAEYKKMDYSQQIQAVFSELLSIYNKSELLHKEAIKLFDKDKSYSPKTLENMAVGATQPSRWLVACAISILAEEKPTIITRILSEDDLFMLFAKPMLDHNKKDKLLSLLKKFKWDFLIIKTKAEVN